MNNLTYATEKTRQRVDQILEGYSVHQLTKDVIRQGLTKDCVDAVRDVELALKALRLVCDDLLSMG